ncbi:MAG TPA: cytochrome b [Rhodocyclaceae bacterium]|nr:cytochrome b [Rhodocyclaceae bacterium]
MTARYTPTAIALHWLVAIGIAGTFALGLYMHDLPLSPAKLELYSYHKWAGVTLFLLVLIRLLWRMGHPAPALPNTMSPLMQKAATAGHLALYALMFAIPLSGWIMSSAKGFQTVWFGVIPLPDLVGKDKALGHQLSELHEFLSYTLLVLVIGHVAAALKHHWIDKDDVLTRMLPKHGAR